MLSLGQQGFTVGDFLGTTFAQHMLWSIYYLLLKVPKNRELVHSVPFWSVASGLEDRLK